jgi:hypothetical protein
MSPAFMKSVRENLPNAAVILDHFHVARLKNGRLDGMRLAVFARGPQEAKDVLRGAGTFSSGTSPASLTTGVRGLGSTGSSR